MKITKNLLLKEEYNKRDLIIINIQPSLENRIYFDLAEFGAWLTQNGNDFNKIYYFYNGDSNPDAIAQITKWFEEKVQIDSNIMAQIPQQDITELRNYFDKILDSDYTDEDIIILGKYMLSKNFDKIENMMPDDIKALTISSEEFREELSNKKYKFVLPHSLLASFKDIRNPIIVGGLKHYSVRMFNILLSIANKKYENHDKWTF